MDGAGREVAQHYYIVNVIHNTVHVLRYIH